MARSAALVDTLKQALKANNMTYAELAAALGLSEASIKRMFSKKDFTLERFDKVCQQMDMEMSDLLRLYERNRHRITRLTQTQEQELVANMELLLVAVCVRNHWTFDDIIHHYNISATKCIRKLARLDRLGIIDLHLHLLADLVKALEREVFF